jgi:hypothetical protein
LVNACGVRQALLRPEPSFQPRKPRNWNVRCCALKFQWPGGLHCHNTLHEDYGMMLLFRVDDVGDTNPKP